MTPFESVVQIVLFIFEVEDRFIQAKYIYLNQLNRRAIREVTSILVKCNIRVGIAKLHSLFILFLPTLVLHTL